MVQLIALVVLLWHSAVFSAAKNPHNITSTTLDNGLKVIVKIDARAPVFISQLWYRVGGADESRPITGISHILEHLMFKGTKAYKTGEFSRIIARNGGSENAFTSKDYTAYYQKMHKSKLAVAIQLEADRMRNLVFNPAEFEKERKVVIEERRMRIEDNPNARVYENLNLISFDEQGAYYAPIIGFQADIEAYQLKQLKAWYQKYYAPNNATLVVVGDVEANQVIALAKQYFGDYKRQANTQSRRASIPLTANNRVLKLKAELPFYAMSFPVPSLKTATQKTDENTDENTAYALEMLAYSLENSLSQALIRNQQLASSINIGYQMYAKFDTLFTISFVAAKGVSNQNLLNAIQNQVAALIKTPALIADELARTKAQLEADFIFAQDRISTQAYYLGMLSTTGLGVDKLFSYVDKMNLIRVQDVANVAKNYLNFNAVNWVELVPQRLQ